MLGILLWNRHRILGYKSRIIFSLLNVLRRNWLLLLLCLLWILCLKIKLLLRLLINITLLYWLSIILILSWLLLILFFYSNLFFCFQILINQLIINSLPSWNFWLISYIFLLLLLLLSMQLLSLPIQVHFCAFFFLF